MIKVKEKVLVHIWWETVGTELFVLESFCNSEKNNKSADV